MRRCSILTKREELNAFIVRADEFIDSKYILANVKIVNLLKSIASSETLMAIFKGCLTDFDYTKAKNEYFIKNVLNDGKGEFIMPQSSRELLALTFSLLMDFDGGKLDVGDFISKYFYENGSIYEGYSAFLRLVIKPFKATVVNLMENVIEGKIQDPVEAVNQEQQLRAQKQAEEMAKVLKEKELEEKACAESIKAIKNFLKEDRKKVKASGLKDEEKEDLALIISTLKSAISSGDKDAITYAFTAYKFVCKAHPLMFRGRIKAVKVELDKTFGENK